MKGKRIVALSVIALAVSEAACAASMCGAIAKSAGGATAMLIYSWLAALVAGVVTSMEIYRILALP
ncbi:MAG TPA: hypothetical protein VFK88_07485 [Gallionella sp.]|nr:hypothetical protein [Gallionella sp.]